MTVGNSKKVKTHVYMSVRADNQCWAQPADVGDFRLFGRTWQAEATNLEAHFLKSNF